MSRREVESRIVPDRNTEHQRPHQSSSHSLATVLKYRDPKLSHAEMRRLTAESSLVPAAAYVTPRFLEPRMPTSRVTHSMRVWRFLESDDPDGRWSRREDLNAPSADYNSAALTLSYTGI
jgi:hypothetical protein